MQRAIGLIAPSLPLDVLAEKLRQGNEQLTASLDDEGLTIRRASDPTRYVTVSLASAQDLAISDYREEEAYDPEFRRTVGTKKIYVLLSNHLPLLRLTLRSAIEYLEQGGSSADTWVDDDHGSVVPANVFMQIMLNHDDWDLKVR